MARASEGSDRRIFVVGVPRSGTTLVQSLLAVHSSMTSFTESHFFSRHFALIPGLPWPILTKNPVPRLREFLEENDALAPRAFDWFEVEENRSLRLRGVLPFKTATVGRRFLSVLDGLAENRGKEGWIEKTPRHLRYLPFLESISGTGGQTRFVHVIRDGLEVVASLFRASRKWERPYDLETCIRRWNDDMQFSLGRITRPTDRFVFYEQLTADPEPTLRRLVEGLGLRWEPQMLERYGQAESRIVTQSETWKRELGRAIRPSATSGSSLTDHQREIVRRGLRDELYRELLDRASAGAVASRLDEPGTD